MRSRGRVLALTGCGPHQPLDRALARELCTTSGTPPGERAGEGLKGCLRRPGLQGLDLVFLVAVGWDQPATLRGCLVDGLSKTIVQACGDV